MSSYSWNGVSGDWNLAGNWTPSGGPPTPKDTALIGGTGAYSVTVDTADAAKSLTLSDAEAAVNVTGSLTLGGSFSLNAGTFNVYSASD
jgi:hypothetical protein